MRNNTRRRQKVTENLCCPRCKSENLEEIDSADLDCGHTQHVILCGKCNQPFVIAVETAEEYLKNLKVSDICLN